MYHKEKTFMMDNCDVRKITCARDQSWGKSRKSSLQKHFQLQLFFFQVINKNANSQSQKGPDKKISVNSTSKKKSKLTNTHTHTQNLFSFSFQFTLQACGLPETLQVLTTSPHDCDIDNLAWRCFKKTSWKILYQLYRKSWKRYDLIYTLYNIISVITNLEKELVTNKESTRNIHYPSL